MINIRKAGLTVLGQPLKISGSVTQDATADLLVTADKLQLKGLLLAAGQMALLKENQIYSGTVSMNASINGKLDKIVPKVNLSIDNVNLKNTPSNTSIRVANSKVNLTTDGKKMDGLVTMQTFSRGRALREQPEQQTGQTITTKAIVPASKALLSMMIHRKRWNQSS